MGHVIVTKWKIDGEISKEKPLLGESIPTNESTRK